MKLACAHRNVSTVLYIYVTHTNTHTHKSQSPTSFHLMNLINTHYCLLFTVIRDEIYLFHWITKKNATVEWYSEDIYPASWWCSGSWINPLTPKCESQCWSNHHFPMQQILHVKKWKEKKWIGNKQVKAKQRKLNQNEVNNAISGVHHTVWHDCLVFWNTPPRNRNQNEMNCMYTDGISR